MRSTLLKALFSQRKNAAEVQIRVPAVQYAMFGKRSLGIQLALLFLHQGGPSPLTKQFIRKFTICLVIQQSWEHQDNDAVLFQKDAMESKTRETLLCCVTGDWPRIIPGIRIIVYNNYNYINHFKKISKYKTYF